LDPPWRYVSCVLMSRLAASTDKTGCRWLIPRWVNCIAFSCMSEHAFLLAARRGPLLPVFTVAFGQWITDGETRPLVEIEREVMRDMAAITSDGPLTR
jgi:hypothetical protein